jgi:hypothetical protein
MDLLMKGKTDNFWLCVAENQYFISTRRELRIVLLFMMVVFSMVPLPALLHEGYGNLVAGFAQHFSSFLGRQMSLLQAESHLASVGYAIVFPVTTLCIVVFNLRMSLALVRFFEIEDKSREKFHVNYFVQSLFILLGMTMIVFIAFSGSISVLPNESRITYWTQWPLSALLGVVAFLIFTAGVQAVVASILSNHREYLRDKNG